MFPGFEQISNIKCYFILHTGNFKWNRRK